MQILDQHDQRPVPSLGHQQPRQRLEGAGPDGHRIERGYPPVTGRQAKCMPQVMRLRHVHGGIVGGDPAGVAYQFEQRQVGDSSPIGAAPALQHGRVVLGQPTELPGQPRLPQAWVPGQAGHLALTVHHDLQHPPQLGKLAVPARERAQTTSGVEPGRAGTQAGHPQRADGAFLDLDRATSSSWK